MNGDGVSSDKPGVSWRLRFGLSLFFLLAGLTIWTTNRLLTDRFTVDTRQGAELQIALNAGRLMSELRQNQILPQLLARDPTLLDALENDDFSRSTQRLISFSEEIGTSSLVLLDLDGRVVAATDRNRLGESLKSEPYFLDTIRGSTTLFTVSQKEAGGYAFVYSRRMKSGGAVSGLIVVEVDLQQYERAWAGLSRSLMVKDSQGTIILSTEPRWRGKSEVEALATETPQNAIQRAIRSTSDWVSLPADAYVQGEGVMRMETKVPFRGWTMTSYTTYASTRERVNSFLALEIMAFAILLSLAFYALNRRSSLRVALFARESAELRQLNTQLQQEIAERKRVQENLAVAEQTLEQSSKLAALGEMSAAVSHELNQPLAAMKTYLAGARLLLRRNRPDEALSAFGRIDDLIERMGQITRQLKSYARKGQKDWTPVNMQDALFSSLSMMEPQLRDRHVQITRNLPSEEVEVFGDRLRIEQVMINLLRNAIDATKGEDSPKIDIILAKGETATVTIRDNGPGIADKDALFEPFYTTKQPGDGVGLGLAISSGIVNDLGGRLTARNGQAGGAVFEMQLPILETRRTRTGTAAAE
ncbi:MAG: ATP-binding protein [Pseudomonadota bacterium]